MLNRFILIAVATLGTLIPSLANAHSSEGGIVLLLPTGYYLSGAAIAVAATFLLVAMLPDAVAERMSVMRLVLGRYPAVSAVPTSLVSFAFLASLVLAGFTGIQDPVENPLPLVIWILWWVGFTVLQALIGSLWPLFNPWTGPVELIRRIINVRPVRWLPVEIGYMLAFTQFAAFIWFELIDLAPSDPGRLAIAVSVYWLFNFGGALLFREGSWLQRAEPFSIFFGLIGGLSPLNRKPGNADDRVLRLVFPGRDLIDQPGLPVIGVLFVVLALVGSAFDGFSRTFLWLGALGINPLEFPGRSAVVISGTLGLIAMFAVQSLLFVGAVVLGCYLAGRMDLKREATGRLIYSMVPIALAFQAAHHLVSVLVDGQNAVIAASDPYSKGWNLFGTAHWHSTTSFLNTLDGVTWIFNTQTAIIVLGHVMGITIAHMLALKIFRDSRAAVVSQIPLAVLMVGYTAFGLWLLSTPRI
jgi:hypothetical protein